jgi:hypothetical protein
MTIFTFGFGQRCLCGRSLAHSYTELDDADDERAVDRMYRLWGQCWSREYASAEAAGVVEYRLTRIETNVDDSRRCRCGARLDTLITTKGQQ